MSSQVLFSFCFLFFFFFTFAILYAPDDIHSASSIDLCLATPAPRKDLPFFWEKLVNLALPSVLSYLPLCPFLCTRLIFVALSLFLGSLLSLSRQDLLLHFVGTQLISVGVILRLWFVPMYFFTGIKCVKLPESNQLLCNAASAELPISASERNGTHGCTKGS